MVLAIFRRALATAALLTMVGPATTAEAGITSVVSGGGSQLVALTSTGPVTFDGTSYPASIISDNLLGTAPTSLSFTYSGVDFATGLRPVFNFTNNTGSALSSLTFTLATPGTSLFGFYEAGTLTPPSTFTTSAQSPDSGTTVTIPISLAAGATEAIYLPISVTATSGSFALTVSETSFAVPEPASLTMTGMAALAGLGYWARRRRPATSA